MVDIKVDPLLQKGKLLRTFAEEVLKAFDTPLIKAGLSARDGSPRDNGDLRSGYRLDRARVRRNEFVATFKNTAPNSLYRERGRPPGKFPPYGETSSLARWAKKRGIPPYLVARKIARQGTERWRRNTNTLGIDRTSTSVDIKIRPNGILGKAIDEIIQGINKIKL